MLKDRTSSFGRATLSCERPSKSFNRSLAIEELSYDIRLGLNDSSNHQCLLPHKALKGLQIFSLSLLPPVACGSEALQEILCKPANPLNEVTMA